jgi:molecular chaperone GrpE
MSTNRPQSEAEVHSAEDAAAAGSAHDQALESAANDLRIAELEAQVREAAERALRGQAELENYRKRAQRELADERKYAISPLVHDLLAVVDNLQRAIEAAQKTSGDTGLVDGVKMVAAQFEGVLKQYGCQRIATVGEPFDPNQHQALAQEPSQQYPAGTVSREMQVGYKLHDRVIRPAQVFVSTGPASG